MSDGLTDDEFKDLENTNSDVLVEDDNRILLHDVIEAFHDKSITSSEAKAILTYISLKD